MRKTREQRTRGGLCSAVRAVLAILCSVALALPASAPALADEAASPARTVRVGFVQQKPLLWMDETGACSGYVYEYLERMAQYTGWSYEFVPIENTGSASYEELGDLLDAGEVDLVAGLMETPSNRASFALTHDGYLALETTLFASMERSDDPISSARADDPLRVATAAPPSLQSDLDEFCAATGIAHETTSYATVTEASDAVRAGDADVLFAVSLADTDGLRAVAHVSSRYLHFAASLEDAELANELDTAFENVERGESLFREQLESTYFSATTDAFSLTADERDFVDRADSIRVGVLKDQPPYQYEEDGEIKGIAVDLLERVAEKTGLSFDYVSADTLEELDALQAAGALDMVAGTNYDYEDARERDLALTQPYVTASYVLVANQGVADGDIAGKRLALAASSRYNGSFVGDVRSFPTLAACLRAVFDGEADYTYVDEYVMQYFLNMPEFRNVRIAPQTHEPRRISFGIARSADPRLLGIVDRAVGSMSEIELQAVINGNVLRERPFDPIEFIRANPAEAIAGVAAVCLIIVLLVLVILVQRVRSNAKTTVDLRKRLQLYALCDDRFFEYDRRTKTLIVSLPGDGQQEPREPLTVDFNGAARNDERRKAFIDLLDTDERRVEEMRMPDADGEVHWLRVTINPVKDVAGRIVYSVGKIEVIDDERRERDRLVARAERDGLTGLLNAETTRTRTSQQVGALGPGEHGALLIVDIDRFKDVNDTYGHLVGDRVLIDVARILHENFRADDVVGRLGGDEFMVFLDRASDASAVMRKCNDLRDVVARHTFPSTDCRVTISVGMVLANAGETFEDLYRRADEALYEAKRDGRNRCGFADGAAPSPKAPDPS